MIEHDGGQMLTKRQVLERHRSVSTAQQSDGSKKYDERREHAGSCRGFRHSSVNTRGRLAAIADTGVAEDMAAA